MITAKRSFHHVVSKYVKLMFVNHITKNNYFKVQYERHEEHKLVTNGVYNFMRHPSYVGWFYWSLGTQVGQM